MPSHRIGSSPNLCCACARLPSRADAPPSCWRRVARRAPPEATPRAPRRLQGWRPSRRRGRPQ
eukprot:11155858-Lingulodinium_polyedra.AAC.1